MIASTKLSLPGSLLAALTVLATTLMTACTATSGDPATANSKAAEAALTETDRLNNWFEQKFEEELQRSPLYLTVLGRKERYDEFDDVSEAREDADLEIARANAAELRAFDYDALTDEAKLSRDIWLYQHERALEAAEFRNHAYVFDQMNGAQSFFPTFMINFHRVDDKADMEAYIARLGGLSDALGVLLGRAQKYASEGIRPPRFAYDGVIDQSQKIVAGAPFSDAENADGTPANSAIWQDALGKIESLVKAGKIDQAQADALTNSTRETLLADFGPAYQRLIDWFKSDIENTATLATGVGALPKGEAYYEERLRAQTTTDMNATEIHQLGLREVERLTKEMHAVMREVEFDGSLQDFLRLHPRWRTVLLPQHRCWPAGLH